MTVCFLSSLAALVFFLAYFQQSLLRMLMDNWELLVWMRTDMVSLTRGCWSWILVGFDDVKLELDIVIDLLQKHVVELQAQKRRPGYRLRNEANEDPFAQPRVFTEAAKDYEAEGVGDEWHEEAQDADCEHDGFGVLIGGLCESHRLILQCWNDNLQVNWQSKSHARQEHQALSYLISVMVVATLPLGGIRHYVCIDQSKDNELGHQTDNKASPEIKSLRS